ncbi:hypothetical protein Tco_0601294 [Tanacetum coccineum]
MTSANDGYNGGAGGKLRKKVLRKTTPYDQPITNPNPKNTSKSSFFSRLIYAVTCAFWRRNPAVTEAPVTGTNEEQRNLRYISSASEISDIETMLKKKTFTRYEIEHLTTYRYEIDEGDKANISKNSLVLRLKESKSGPLNKHAEERENLHVVISIPRAFQEDVASPVELARARSRGRTAMYRMSRSPYYRGPSTLSKKPTPSLISWELEGSNEARWYLFAGKRRSSVQDDLGYGGPMRRIRQKAERCSEGKSLQGNSGKWGDHLERTIPREKPSSSRLARTTEKSATKLTSNLALRSQDKVESSKFLLSSQNNQKTEGQHRIEENGPQRFAVPLIVLSSMNGNSTAPTTNAPSTLALPAEPPQKKPAF